MAEKTFAKGFYGNKPAQGAPDFVVGRLSLKSEDAIEFIKAHTNEKGYCNIDILEGKEGKLNLVLNTYVSKPKQDANGNDLPF